MYGILSHFLREILHRSIKALKVLFMRKTHAENIRHIREDRNVWSQQYATEKLLLTTESRHPRQRLVLG